MASSILTADQLVEKIKAYRALGTKARSQAKRNPLGKGIKATLLAQEDVYDSLVNANEVDLAMSLSVEQRRLNLLRDAEARSGGTGTMRLDLNEVRTRIRNIVADRKAQEELAEHSTEVIGLDVTKATLAELTSARRAVAAVFRRQERPTDEVANWAMSALDLVDDELYLRVYVGLKAALIKESALLAVVESTERSGGTVASHIVEELADLRRGIANHLSHYGTTTRWG